ncbi:redoxin family protein [Paractinoplanes toevensis]|uniref:Thioredoxin domain-containing protein n=1 Tax=Paractinoplanes toevensis TaxID=571911 RepID=A0A920BP67_9ACTN|nr:redoxin family protein [Actinoplanes toevensis]GIM96537.1 hypothetical protein Ato02nite_083300 [Actinoplanes toevensis]
MAGSPQLPSFTGAAAWLNSAPLSPQQVRGRVVLVNFWTLTCINWLRQEPYVRAWSRAYRNDGLVVIGVHTPEFGFEHDVDGVKRAVEVREIDYPVAVDNDYAIWSAFDNHYWPALYFADRDGGLRDFHFGEGRYEESERRIQRLLGIHREPAAVRALGVEAPADWDHLRTPETYLGTARGERFASPGGARSGSHDYARPGYLDFNDWALDGTWTIGRESVELDAAGGTIGFRFQARDAHVVLSAAGDEPIPFRVFVDGEAPGANHGEDVDEDGNGELGAGRLYQLFREREKVGERTLEITFSEPGARAYAFTFG